MRCRAWTRTPQETGPIDPSFPETLAGLARTSGRLPLTRDAAAFLDALLGLLFPGRSDDPATTADEVRARLAALDERLGRLLEPLLPPAAMATVRPAFFDALPELQARIADDAAAIHAGDPAAERLDEVVAAYPGFLAIAIHRIANRLVRLGVPILPRLFAEIAHTRTGIDIHPGATIGRRLCIDHGTGVVVGETAVIGDDVKLYQGVTLGALSVSKSVAGTKRHPTIGDRVVIYANATVLGGETVVGADSIVGGNVWLTSSVPPSSIVYHTSHVKIRSTSDGFDTDDFVI